MQAFQLVVRSALQLPQLEELNIYDIGGLVGFIRARHCEADGVMKDAYRRDNNMSNTK